MSASLATSTRHINMVQTGAASNYYYCSEISTSQHPSLVPNIIMPYGYALIAFLSSGSILRIALSLPYRGRESRNDLIGQFCDWNAQFMFERSIWFGVDMGELSPLNMT